MPVTSILIGLHALGAVIWVGGMAFAYMFLRPAAARTLPAAERQQLWRSVFGGFFAAVWASLIVLLASGYYLVLGTFGGFGSTGVHVHVMHALGLLMGLIFVYVYLVPWPRFRHAVQREDHAAGAVELDRIRRLVAMNLVLGLIVVFVATSGRFW